MPPLPLELSDQALELIASRFRALGEASRLKLIHALQAGEKNVGELVQATGLTQANVSRHLQNLTAAGILSRRKEGLTVKYVIADAGIFKLCDTVCGSVQAGLAQRVNAFQSPAASPASSGGQTPAAAHRAPRRRRVAGIVGIALAALLAGCSPDPTPAPERVVPPAVTNGAAPSTAEAALLVGGQAIVAQAFGILSSNLQSALAQGGPTNALQFCSVHALTLTADLGAKDKFALRRVALRYRNPQNQPSAAEQEVLRGFESSLAAGRKPEPVLGASASGRRVFYAPILIANPLCLTCHGDPQQDIPAASLALVRQLYPEDKATGFKLGDLRGMWAVEFR